MAGNLILQTAAFDAGAAIPRKYTCEGDNVSPALSWSNVPEGARSLALIVDDPDAPRGTFVHWVLFNLPPEVGTLPEGVRVREHFKNSELRPVEGANDFGKTGYGGPCPPRGDRAHRYFFKLYALDTTLDLREGATKKQVTQAMDGHVLDESEYVGTYRRA